MRSANRSNAYNTWNVNTTGNANNNNATNANRGCPDYVDTGYQAAAQQRDTDGLTQGAEPQAEKPNNIFMM